MIESIRLKSSAHQKLAMLKPGTKALVSIMRNAFRTNVNNPSVNMLIGKVKIKMTGLTNALISPKTNAVIKAAAKPSTVTPGKRYADITTARVLTNQLIRKFIINYYSKLKSRIYKLTDGTKSASLKTEFYKLARGLRLRDSDSGS